MGNPSRAKGTSYEVELLADLRRLYPEVERAPLKGIHDAGDFINVPFPIEAKNTKQPRIPEWARRLNAIDPLCWVLLWSGGDRRRKEHPGELMVLPKKYGLYLLSLDVLYGS